MANFIHPRTPPSHISSFYLEPDEVQLSKIRVTLHLGGGYVAVPGYLHFSTRSILFSPVED